MKRSIFLFLVLLTFYPIGVKANIVCNDGTISPGCSDCHRGCCSQHGGCSNSNSSSSSSSLTNNKPIVTEKVKSSDTSLKKVSIDEEDIAIANNMVYSTTKESVTIRVIANDSKATLDYQKNPNLTIGENVVSIKVTAENGSVKNYKLSITREKILSANKNIKIFVMGQEVIFNLFKSDVINIASDQEKLDITYELEDSNAHVEIIGNENLQVGHNEIIVRVIAENGEEQDYTLIVEKEETKAEIKEDEKSELGIFAALGSSALLGGAGYLIYKGIKKK